MRFNVASALALGVFVAQGSAYAQSLDARAGAPIENKGYWPVRADQFLSVTDDPNLAIAVGPHSDHWWSRWSNATPQEMTAAKDQTDAFAKFGVPSVEIKSTGTVNGVPAVLVPRYEGAAFDSAYGGREKGPSWIANVDPEKSLRSLKAIEKGVEDMQAHGYSVSLSHLLIERDGTVRVLAATVKAPPKADGAGVGPAPWVASEIAGQKQHNKLILDRMREGVKVVDAFEKAGIPRQALERIDKEEALRRQANGPSARAPQPSDKDRAEADRLIRQLAAAIGATTEAQKEMAEDVVRDWLGMREKHPELAKPSSTGGVVKQFDKIGKP